MIGTMNVVTTLPVTDIEVARDYYANALKLREVKTARPDEAVFDAGDGSRIYLYHREAPTVSDQTSCSFQVRDLAKTMADLRSRGVVFENYDAPGLQTVDGVATLGPVRAAWFKDPDGNILGLSEGHPVLAGTNGVHAAANGRKNGHKRRRSTSAKRKRSGSAKASSNGAKRKAARKVVKAARK